MTGERPQGKTNLMTACEQGRTLEAKIILQKKPHTISTRDKHGKTALHYCAESGAIACAQLLLGGADRTLLDTPDSEGFTPLHLAVISGHKAIAKLLLRAGADPDSVDKERHSAVHWAAVCGDVESLDMLLSHGASPSTPDILGAYPIHYAAQMCGAHSLNGKDPETGLNTLRKLVQKGASIQCRDRDGREPMLWAASAGSSEAVLVLFTAGANIAASDKDGLTALHCAASRGHTACVETLIALCGARVDAGDNIGCSALFYAAAQGQADCAQVLLKHCADPNRQDDKGRTPAHCAAVKGRLEILRILDSNGADLWIRNSRGNLPLHEAVVSGRKDLVQWLLQQCPRAVNATNISGRTPLHIAAQRNNVEMCEVLIDYGAFINPLMVNAKGFLMTPLDASVYQGNQRCAKYLQLHGAVPATKVLENNEINRNLLFSLGNFAYQQKERSDDEPSSANMSTQTKDLLQPPNVRDTLTRTIRGGQQPPLQQSQVPPESELTNVMSEEPTDASVHIHLTRDDLWSLWESLMQELTSEMSGSEISQGSERKHKSKKKTTEVRQLKPILTNVYVRRDSSRSQLIAGESIYDRNADEDALPTRSVSEDTKLRYPKRATDDLKITLPRVSEAEKSKSTEEDRHTTSSHISGLDMEDRRREKVRGEPVSLSYLTDSVGSDTEHRSAVTGTKATRLRKRRSDGRSWGKEPEESETSSGHRQEQREANPYLKRYFQKQARAAEMRKYLESQNIGAQEEESSHPPALDRRKGASEKFSYTREEAYENLEEIDHNEQDLRKRHTHSEISEKSKRSKKDEKRISKSTENLQLEVPTKLNRSHRSKASSVANLDKVDSHHSTHSKRSKDRKHKTCDCKKIMKETEGRTDKENWHHEGCRLRKRHNVESPEQAGRKKRGTSPAHQLNRKSSKNFLEVPSQHSAASDERSEDIPLEEEMKLRLHYHHHHHHHHHHHPHHHLSEKEVIISEDKHHLERHLKHKRHFHRKKSRTKDEKESMTNLTERKIFSDGEYQQETNEFYSGSDIRRSKSEMSDFPCYVSRDVLTQSPVPEISEHEGSDIIDKDEFKSDVKEPTKDTDSISMQENEKQHRKLKSEISEKKRDSRKLADTDQKVDDPKSVESSSKKPDGKQKVRDGKLKIKSSKEDSSPEQSDKMLKAQDSKSSSRRKGDREKKSSKVVRNIKKSSPRRETKIPGKPPLKPAQSFSEPLSLKTKNVPLKPKSQSARIEKDLPEIKVFSVEGSETELLVRKDFELSELTEASEKSNDSTEIQEQNNLGVHKAEDLEKEPAKQEATTHAKARRSKRKEDTDKNTAALTEGPSDTIKLLNVEEQKKSTEHTDLATVQTLEDDVKEAHEIQEQSSKENVEEKDLGQEVFQDSKDVSIPSHPKENKETISYDELDSGEDEDEPDEILYRDDNYEPDEILYRDDNYEPDEILYRDDNHEPDEVLYRDDNYEPADINTADTEIINNVVLLSGEQEENVSSNQTEVVINVTDVDGKRDEILKRQKKETKVQTNENRPDKEIENISETKQTPTEHEKALDISILGMQQNILLSIEENDEKSSSTNVHSRDGNDSDEDVSSKLEMQELRPDEIIHVSKSYSKLKDKSEIEDENMSPTQIHRTQESTETYLKIDDKCINLKNEDDYGIKNQEKEENDINMHGKEGHYERYAENDINIQNKDHDIRARGEDENEQNDMNIRNKDDYDKKVQKEEENYCLDEQRDITLHRKDDHDTKAQEEEGNYFLDGQSDITVRKEEDHDKKAQEEEENYFPEGQSDITVRKKVDHNKTAQEEKENYFLDGQSDITLRKEDDQDKKAEEEEENYSADERSDRIYKKDDKKTPEKEKKEDYFKEEKSDINIHKKEGHGRKAREEEENYFTEEKSDINIHKKEGHGRKAREEEENYFTDEHSDINMHKKDHDKMEKEEDENYLQEEKSYISIHKKEENDKKAQEEEENYFPDEQSDTNIHKKEENYEKAQEEEENYFTDEHSDINIRKKDNNRKVQEEKTNYLSEEQNDKTIHKKDHDQQEQQGENYFSDEQSIENGHDRIEKRDKKYDDEHKLEKAKCYDMREEKKEENYIKEKEKGKDRVLNDQNTEDDHGVSLYDKVDQLDEAIRIGDDDQPHGKTEVVEREDAEGSSDMWEENKSLQAGGNVHHEKVKKDNELEDIKVTDETNKDEEQQKNEKHSSEDEGRRINSDISEKTEIELVEETAKHHVRNIIQRAESEIQKHIESSAFEKSDFDTLKSDENPSPEGIYQNSNQPVQLNIIEATPNFDEREFVDPNDDHFSEPESTSEAETRFNTDSEEIQPEPDLDILLLSEDAESLPLDKKTVKNETKHTDVPSESASDIKSKEIVTDDKKRKEHSPAHRDQDVSPEAEQTESAALNPHESHVQDLEAKPAEDPYLEQGHDSTSIGVHDLDVSQRKGSKKGLRRDSNASASQDPAENTEKSETSEKQQGSELNPEESTDTISQNMEEERKDLRTEAMEKNKNEINQKLNLLTTDANENDVQDSSKSKINIDELATLKKIEQISKSQQTIESFDNNSTHVSGDTRSTLFPSAEVQTDIYGKTRVFEIGVNVEKEVNNFIGFNRSISVQTSDYDSGVAAVLGKIQNKDGVSFPSSFETRKSISVQTESSKTGLIPPDDPSEEIKQAIRTANFNDISGKSRSLAQDAAKVSKLTKDTIQEEKSPTVQRSPERHNPSAVFYTANNIITESPKKENENIGAMFYKAPAMIDRGNVNSKSSPNLYVGVRNKDNIRFRQADARRKPVRSTIRDRSLESERAVAIANTAFHRLNSKGELTVFNSSLITVPSNAPVARVESKPTCQRREYSNLEKSGFLWVHFGSGSSPISTLRRKPSLTSQKTKRESNLLQSNSTNASKNVEEDEKKTTKVSSNNRISRRNEVKKDVGPDTPSRNKAEKKPLKEKKSPRKPDAHASDALQVSSKVLTDKKSNKLKREDSKNEQDDKQNETRSKIPHKLSDSNVRKQEEVVRSEEGKGRIKKENDARKRGKIPEMIKSEQSPRRAIPRLYNENTYVRNSDEQANDERESNIPKNYGEISESSQNLLPEDLNKMNDPTGTERGKTRKPRKSPSRKQHEIRREITFSKSEREGIRISKELDVVMPNLSIESSTASEESKTQTSSPKRKKRSSSRKKEDSPKDKEESPKNNEESPKRKEDIPKKKVDSPKKKEDIPKTKEDIPKTKEDSPKKKEDNPKKKENITKRKEDSPEKKEESPKKRKENRKKPENEPANIEIGSSKASKRDSPRENVKLLEQMELGSAKEAVLENPEQNETGNSKRSERKSHKTREKRKKKSEKDSPRKNENFNRKQPNGEEEYEQRYDLPGSRDDGSSNSSNTRVGDNGSSRQRRRLSETAKSSSLDEGDVRLVIERKADPDFSIKIRMSDKHRKGEKHKDSNNMDFSSTQCESDQSYVKDSGYISTSESVHKHKRSITIDLGHTTAKINAGMKGASKTDGKDTHNDTEPQRISLPEVDEGKEVADQTNRNKNQNTHAGSHKVLPSKLPVLSSHRQRSNSMIIMSYNRTPRRNSISSDVQDSSEVQTERGGSDRKRTKGRSSRQIEHGADKNSGKLSRGSSGIPIYRAQSDSNLQQLGKPSPRFSSQSLSNLSVPEMNNGRMVMSDRKMDSIVEHSFSSSDLQSDLKSQSRSPDNLKLPSIRLSRPEEAEFFGYHTDNERFPVISPRSKPGRSSKHSSPIPSGMFSPDFGSFKLPMLQTPMRFKCNIEPYENWDSRRTKSAVDCVANLHFLSEEEMAQFDQRLFAMSRRTSFSSGKKKRRESPMGYRAIRTQTLKRLRSGRKSAESVTFHVDHDRERNSFKLPTEKLKKNKKWKVVFTIGKSESEDKEDKADEKKS